MVHVDEEGKRIGGAHKAINTAGFIIHAAIHKARPDINAACHVHSPYGRAWSNFGRGIDMLNQGMRTPVGSDEVDLTSFQIRVCSTTT
jgi:ribulose-5-phosphate 4-epimerase/fuculose-1-phosphate aldolase